METDGRFARREPVSVSTQPGNALDSRTKVAAEPAQSSTYELRPLPNKARNTAPAGSSTHDDSTLTSERPALPLDTNHSAMSRAPLLVRSSPAQGTGSYGGLPVLSVSSSPDDSDHHVTNLLRRGKRRGKTKLRNSELSNRRTQLESSNDGSPAQTDPIFTTSSRSPTSTPLDGALPAPDARFNTGGLTASGMAAPRIFESLQSSSTTSSQDERSEDDDSSDESLHDSKFDPHSTSDNSPYAQVRAAVPASDDFTLSINTPRMWTLSMFFAILGSSTNLFFSLRYPSVSITPVIALLLVHPLGLLWDQMLKRPHDPEEVFENGLFVSRGNSRPGSSHNAHLLRSSLSWRTRCRLWLAQGRWNLKEHCCVYISSNVSFGFAFATDVSFHV